MRQKQGETLQFINLLTEASEIWSKKEIVDIYCFRGPI